MIKHDDDKLPNNQFWTGLVLKPGEKVYFKVWNYNQENTGSYKINIYTETESILNMPNQEIENIINESLGNPDGTIYTPHMSLELEHLYLQSINTNDGDLNFLTYATNLRDLWITYGKISDISILEGLTNLESLYLFGNQISDISSIAALTKIE